MAGIRHGVCGDQLFDRAVQQVRSRLIRQETVGNDRIDFGGAFAFEQVGGGTERPGCGGQVVNDHAGTSVDISDEVGGFHGRGIDAAFGDHGESAVEAVRKTVRHLDTAGVGGDDDGLLINFDDVAQILDENGRCVEVIHRNIKEALNLLCVKIHCEDTVRPGADQQIGYQFGGDGNAGAVLAVLSCVAVVGDYGGDAGCRSAACRIHHNQQFHEVLIGRIASRLNDEHIRIAEIVFVLDENLTVGESFDLHMPQFHPQTFRN